MKKTILSFMFLLLSFSLFALPESERNITESESSPFVLNPAGDIIFSAGVLGTLAVSRILPKIIDLPEYYEKSYAREDINGFDRIFAKQYNRTLDNMGTATVTACYAMAPLVFCGELLAKNLEWKDAATLLVMYAQTVALGKSIKGLLKSAVHRTRPYMYFEGYPTEELDNYDFEYSFPSGHSLDAFMTATFASYTFCKYYPKSKFKIPLIAVSYSLATATAALRVSSGNHFATDVLAGAAIGTAVGFLVPWCHTFSRRISNEKMQMELSPAGANLSFRL